MLVLLATTHRLGDLEWDDDDDLACLTRFGDWELQNGGRYFSAAAGANYKALVLLLMVALIHPSYLDLRPLPPRSPGAGRVGTPPRQLPHRRQPPDEQTEK